jgi:hypothetical protein
MRVVIGRSRVNPSRRPSHLLGDLLRRVVEVIVPARIHDQRSLGAALLVDEQLKENGDSHLDSLIHEHNPHVRG